MQTLPTTIAEAATYMLTQLDDSQKAELRALPQESLIMCHFGLAMRIRNELKLCEPNHPLATGELFFDADDGSMAIVPQLIELKLIELKRSDFHLRTFTFTDLT